MTIGSWLETYWSGVGHHVEGICKVATDDVEVSLARSVKGGKASPWQEVLREVELAAEGRSVLGADWKNELRNLVSKISLNVPFFSATQKTPSLPALEPPRRERSMLRCLS